MACWHPGGGSLFWPLIKSSDYGQKKPARGWRGSMRPCNGYTVVVFLGELILNRNDKAAQLRGLFYKYPVHGEE